MVLTDAHLATLLIGLAVFALVLGGVARVVAIRLFLDQPEAANDPVYRPRFNALRQARAARRSRPAGRRVSLRLVRSA